ncbi:hypothetical protein KVR01_011640 [Diaporthe batatas]|uniref:uncharacterized protein n=1 Tax=Diaporthe batatas TaxID=748121 RepID=UPI001D04A287|nr:uncharacterized protein KVR01_011640 [Diaporthe batatas]KAG8158518.1 hypothetical protein KVR01_011640 [Diaporthe batatas]
MTRGPSKPRARCCRLQEKRPELTTRSTPELPKRHRDLSQVDGGLVRNVTITKKIKQPLCLVSTEDQPPGSAASIRPSRTLSTGQIEADPVTSLSQRPGLRRRNTQQGANFRQTRNIEQPPRLKRPSTTLQEVQLEEQRRAFPSTQLYKRPINGGGSNNGHQFQRVELTRKNLAQFNEMARKKGANKAPVSIPLESTAKSTSTKSTTLSGFAMKAYKNGILDPLSSKPPTNIDDIRTRYAESRGTASPTESMYEDYIDVVQRAPNKATMLFEVGGKLLNRYPREGYPRVFDQSFTNFPEDACFNSGFSAPQPDFIEGLEMPAYRPFPIDEHIKGAVIYQDNPRSLVLPHIAGEWKGPGKNMQAARQQSVYDGAALVYARNQGLAYMGASDPPGHAEVATFTTDGTNLNLFAHYAAPSAAGDGTLEYHQYQVKTTNLMESRQGLKDGIKWLRNAQDHAKKQSYTLRDQLNEKWRKQSATLRQLDEGGPQPVADGTIGIQKQTKLAWSLLRPTTTKEAPWSCTCKPQPYRI